LIKNRHHLWQPIHDARRKSAISADSGNRCQEASGETCKMNPAGKMVKSDFKKNKTIGEIFTRAESGGRMILRCDGFDSAGDSDLLV